MQQSIIEASNGHQIYDSMHKSEGNVPFRVATGPLRLEPNLIDDIVNLGPAIAAYLNAVCELYMTDERVHQLLDQGKPNIFKGNKPKYLFFRPDLILTAHGLKICEIEVSPFGLALSDILTKAYAKFGLMVDTGELRDHAIAHVPETGTVIHSHKTRRFVGQLDYLASEIFSGKTSSWISAHADEISDLEEQFYRGFYLHETVEDSRLHEIANGQNCIPSPTPFFEEKAILSLIWDTRFTNFLKQSLGESLFERLRRHIPPTWVIGNEDYFEPGLPNGTSQTIDIASLGKSKRKIVLKSSGFCDTMSWGHGVHFLDKVSGSQVRQHIQEILDSNQSTLYICQDFTEPIKIDYSYFQGEDVVAEKMATRITPYYAAIGDSPGHLLSIKATGRNGSRHIHAATDSVNTPVAEIGRCLR